MEAYGGAWEARGELGELGFARDLEHDQVLALGVARVLERELAGGVTGLGELLPAGEVGADDDIEAFHGSSGELVRPAETEASTGRRMVRREGFKPPTPWVFRPSALSG